MNLPPGKINRQVETVIGDAELSRYYLTAYIRAERENKLDGTVFTTLEEQKRWFAVRAHDARYSLRGNLSALRALFVDALHTATPDTRPQIEAQIEALDEEIAAIKGGDK